MKNGLVLVTLSSLKNSVIDYNKQFLKMVRINNRLSDKGG